MTNFNIRKLQLAELLILIEIKRICEKHKILYWLDSGTALGAKRHKGFIPWDDDADVGMKRSDYERFLKIAEIELDSRFYIQHWNKTKGYCLPFAKIRLKNTKVVESSSKNIDIPKGIWVDIFPYDTYIPNNPLNLIIKIILKYLTCCIYIKSGMKPWVTRNQINLKSLVKYSPFILFSPMVNVYVFKKIYEKIRTFYNDRNGDYHLYELGSGFYGHCSAPMHCFENVETVKFESIKFPVPNHIDEYLKCFYGNYMELPPLEKRVEGHNITEIDFGNYTDEIIKDSIEINKTHL